jgi:hypothetical protein
MLTERGELHVRKGMIFMNWLPPIEVSCILDGGKLCSYQLGLATNRTAENSSHLFPRLHALHLRMLAEDNLSEANACRR